uniref:Adaptor related protein complex 5 subunit zeta 1 n=1 Tax=Esox lucius TaxID=8010 RepID=A0AAY5L8S2_ESOLU
MVAMYSVGTESLIKQARDIGEVELQKFYSRITKQLTAREHSHDVIDSLQRLHLILASTKYTRRLPVELHRRLLSLCVSSSVEQMTVLTSAVLREALPPSGPGQIYTLQDYCPLNSHTAALVLSQAGCKEDLSALSSLLLRSLEGRAAESPSPTQTLGLTHCLPIVNTVITYSPDSLTEDHVIFLSKKLVEWLRYASLQQGMSSSGGFFASPRIRQPGTVAELDGCVCGDFFTVLCVSPSFSEDQWMNLYSFSLLRHWLITYHNGTDGNTSTDTEDRSEVDGSVVSMVSATSSSSRVLPPKERLREKSLEYCQRLVEQSDRKALKRADTELQKACLVEAVCILDSVCLGDPGFVYRAFPCVKALFGRLSSDLSYSRVLLPIAQFYLNHGETAAVDSECVWRCVWGVLPAECFNQPFLAHEMLTFIRANQLLLKTSVPLYSRYFPNLLKFLAWDSPSLVSDYLDVLPSLVTTGTALELLHSLLDLPCLTAALTLQLRSACFPVSEPGGRGLTSLEAFRSPAYRGLFLFLLRREAGSGDTIDRLSVLHDLLMEAADWPRVVQSAQSVPVLLHVYFNTITTISDKRLLAQLVLVLLERSSLLLNIPSYPEEIHRVFSYHLLRLCKHHPSLVVDQSRELLEFAGITANVHSKEELYTHVVWVLGEYLSVSSDPRCSVDLVTSCFEALEAVLFEVTSSGCPSPRVVTSLLSTLAKLASRSHDLIPRVSLFLSKLRSGAISWCHSEEDVVAIVTRGEELWSLLKLPSVALSVLTPPLVVTTPSWHGDTNTALPPRLRSLTSLTHTPLKHN